MATTDTEVDLIVNEMTQEQLDELDAAGTVPPNQMFFTEDDASNSVVTLPVGSIFASAIPLTDPAFHLLDGSVISQTGIYEDFSNLLKSLVTAGYAITCTLSQYETDITNTGNCGKFVIDNTAGTIKLPTITKFVEGLSNLTDIGKSLQAGLPNITGNTTGNTWDEVGFGSWTSGAFQISNIGSDATEHFNPVWAAGATRRPTKVNLNASRSSAVYGRSSEVQPNATRYPYYIVLANSYKSKVALNVDCKAGLADDNVFTGINKFNNTVNFSEVPTVNGASINNLSMVPSSNVIWLNWTKDTVGGTTYTAPSNGYFCIAVQSDNHNSSTYVLTNKSNDLASRDTVANYGNAAIFVPCRSGDVINYDYDNKPSNFWFAKFIESVNI